MQSLFAYMHPERSVAIFWDYENCPAPSSVSGYELVNKIRRTAHNYGTIKLFKAYLDNSQHTSARALSFKSELQSSGVSLTDCPHNGKKNVCDVMMIVDMLAHAIDNPNSWTFILITGDRDFAYATSVLRLRKYEVVLISSSIPKAHVSLKSQANTCLDWNAHIIQNTTYQTDPSTLVSLSSVPPPAVRHVSVGIQLEEDGLQKGDKYRSVGVQDDRFLSCVRDEDKQAFDPTSVGVTYQTLYTASLNALISVSNELLAFDTVPSPPVKTVGQDNETMDLLLQSPASDATSDSITTRISNSPETTIASPLTHGEKSAEPHSPAISLATRDDCLPNVGSGTQPSSSNVCSYDITSLQLTSPSTLQDNLSCYMSVSSEAQPPIAEPTLSTSEASFSASSNLATIIAPRVSGEKPLPTEFLALARVLEKFRLAGISCPSRTAVANELSRDGKSVKKIYAPYHNKPFARYTEAAIKEDVIVTGGIGGKEWISLHSAWHGKVP